MILRSSKFDDVYFSADDGLAETRHVFLNGNDLPKAWYGQKHFTIAEAGFGTGLNFLATWKLFEETADHKQRLHFISVEKYPLSKDDIQKALSPWGDELGDYIERYLQIYPLRIPGPHHIYINDRVTLTIWFGDIADILPEWSGQVDAWFLDGFTPAKNPDMWSDILFETMTRLSHEKTSFATFTAAGFVKRGLDGAGFTVEKTKGFGRKRDMMRGVFGGCVSRKDNGIAQSLAIIGGGLAGCAMAFMAARHGIKATIYEAGHKLATGASGGQKGMINPKLTAKQTAQSDYYGAAYAHALRILPEINDIDFESHGTKHICTDADKDRRFTGYCDNLGWYADHLYRDDNGDMMYPDAASVCPEKLCHRLARHADIHLNYTMKTLDDIDADVIILANGHAVNDFIMDDLPVNWVRGQVSWVKPQDDITQNISYGGYITPLVHDHGGQEFHVVGSTLDPRNRDITLLDDDHIENLRRYNDRFNKNLTLDDVIGGWAALRTSSKDRFPIVGHVRDNIYISTAHGSHGIISSLYSADIIMAQIMGKFVPASRVVQQALSPDRFDKTKK